MGMRGPGERHGRLTAELGAPGRADPGQHLAQRGGLGAVAGPAEVPDEGDRPVRKAPRLIDGFRQGAAEALRVAEEAAGRLGHQPGAQ